MSKQQGEQILKLLNRILSEKIDMATIMLRLDEIHRDVNPNAPKTTYTFIGNRRIASPGVNRTDDSALPIYDEMLKLGRAGQWAALLTLAEIQIKERPEWLTPYVFAGDSHSKLGRREKALELLEFAERRIAGNPDYEPLQPVLTRLLQNIRGR